MHANQFGPHAPGTLVPIPEGVLAFVPHPLPTTLTLSPELVVALDDASRAVSLLAGAGEWLPNPHLLMAPFLRREAVLSSRIEGTQASLSDLLVYEAGGRADADDAREVANYVAAMDHGRELLKELPISIRLVRELHAVLMDGVRGEEKRPGELRDRQVHIGPQRSRIEDATFVPPPYREIERLLGDWERFVHDDGPLPPLVRCALMHYQFETIHPFNDGNGRVGRLLIPLFLIEQAVLPTPLLYLSAYFEHERNAYYDELLAVSTDGNWERWIAYFLAGVTAVSREAVGRVRTLHGLQASFRARLRGASANALLLADSLGEWPVVSAPSVAQRLGVTDAGARRIIAGLIGAGILTPLRQGRPQLYAALEIIAALED